MLGLSALKNRLFGARPDPVAALYGDIVAAARLPAAYRDWGVSDDFEGRFERLCLMMTLVLRRLKSLPAPADAIGQLLVDCFFASLDDGLRRAGIGDLSVGKRVKKLAQAFYGRAEAYTAALAEADPAALDSALARNLYGARVAPEAVPAGQRAEIGRLIARLDAADIEGLLAGNVLAGAAGEGRDA